MALLPWLHCCRGEGANAVHCSHPFWEPDVGMFALPSDSQHATKLRDDVGAALQPSCDLAPSTGGLSWLGI